MRIIFRLLPIICIAIFIIYNLADDEPEVIENLPPIVSINTGEVRYQGSGSRKAPFTVSAVGGNSDFFIKLRDSESKKVILVAYVKSGTKFKTKVPLGSYELVYASGGTVWRGEDYLFGSKTTISQSDKVFLFTKSGNTFTGHIITLKQVQGGNLKVKLLDRNNF